MMMMSDVLPRDVYHVLSSHPQQLEGRAEPSRSFPRLKSATSCGVVFLLNLISPPLQQHHVTLDTHQVLKYLVFLGNFAAHQA